MRKDQHLIWNEKKAANAGGFVYIVHRAVRGIRVCEEIPTFKERVPRLAGGLPSDIVKENKTRTKVSLSFHGELG
jgi:hypothetical protein